MALHLSRAFGRAVREIRVERGLSQAAVAEAAGVDRAYYGHVERATKSPTLDTVERVARALDVPASVIFELAERLDSGPLNR